MDHGERSQLGRKVAEQRDKIQELEETVRNLQQGFESQPLQQPYVDPYTQPQQASQTRDPDDFITWGDIEKAHHEQVQRQQMYQSAYRNSVAQLGTDLSEQEYGKVVEIISLLRTYDMRSKGWEGNTQSDGALLKELIFKILHL